MCGIIGYIGNKQATPFLLQGLRRLEYRGYDSAGMVVIDNTNFNCIKSVGKIDKLAEKLKQTKFTGNIGIAHTRWATHGGVTIENAHPHFSADGSIVLVHNGIIENYRELKDFLGNIEYKSETDSEILVNLIAHFYKGDLRIAVESALLKVRGTYGIVVMHKDKTDCLVAARMGSPLVIGVGEGEYYLASDATPLLAHTNKVVFLEDGEIAEVCRNSIQTYNLKDEQIVKCVEQIDWNDEQAEKQGYENFMLKEIYDQPTVYKDAIRGRINLDEATAHLGGLNMTPEQMKKVDRIILIACGTASYAAMVGKYAFERLAGIPTEVDVASEFRYRDPIITENTLVFGVSQSGETADTIAALREAKRKGAYVRGIVNVVGSTIARETDGGTYIHAGPELAVASTKAYTNMSAILLLYALQFGRSRRLSIATGERICKALLEIPEKMQSILDNADAIKEIALKYKDYKNCFFLGRGSNYPVAREGSLKLKEISYIHSESYPGGEMKHGPIALLSDDFPVIAIMTKNQLYDKMWNNIQEVKARNSKVLIIATIGDEKVKDLADDVIYVPDTMELLEPLLNTLPLQLLAYYIAVALGRDVDRPRNLAKSVTVE
ncbi:MAG: glutamine--fructose-6-phosphate aminotransferase [Candidatus Magasanikbacteria bacterium RIFCSPHIGHO2_01_FULL_33_34]|uniref:Glutamine--fructose-6-phosphate aminotransferase [isomerizing] n=1 Tax=Candidatus Magasanikbacteria bacterium RIFCSPHIGHO2_01_FULL_33_34 TaxID=1798671 RepID=A0A1F6LJE5_9BACT|nr:MAG: glutamine--fructose-6-phosphate aminotransferase [Candidatus Magasanikbacteria bacterium RIFCSPHIGHO2_01_FULL_33_34]OGH65520.1 MAG: glutamine--fructose-6-phosphate aminotransferase [Candidatus Magasanikbacteria bacterium RIFCSPHIGHO2_02_FULL_33_17]OGH76230.1 MAG: glutamine--fructose-6-phosphate aminotransferase [Candidatus Magasanikbacteria bacterium RIFCSPLOWO2_01_FULL_33_34]OGH81636.1 MAG: glutamine--fructose-6-phosphate aminotransferase [Candidatus Magasanikbacteria bacterium RIFCSPLO